MKYQHTIAAKIIAFLIRAFSQLFSLFTFGWFRPGRETMPFLSTSARAGRGHELRLWPWTFVAPMIDWWFAYDWPLIGPLDGPDHCGSAWRWYRHNRL